MTLRRLWPLIAYFVLFGGLGWFTYHSTDDFARTMGEAFGALAIVSMVGWAYSLFRKKPVNWLPRTIIATLVTFNSMSPRLMSALDVQLFKTDLAAVPAENLASAIAANTDTALGKFLRHIIAMGQET